MEFGKAKVYAGLLVMASCGLAGAQTNTTSFSGAVDDLTGARLPGTTVTLKNAANGAVDTFETNKLGEFSFPQLVPGHYTVTIHHEGFTDEQTQVDLFISTPVTQNFKLAVGSSDQTVVVEASLPTSLNNTDASLGKAFDDAQIQTLPYLANNTLSLLALQPGVIAFDGSNTTDVRAGAINGARQDQTNITLDGVDNNDANYGYAFTGVLRATRDSIEEFRVTTSGANADAGRSSGAQVSLQTKSGTNNIRGSAYYYYRDPGAASNNWFSRAAGLGTAKVLQHTFGGTLGFPVLHDKLFAFAAYEGYKQASSATVTRTVPLGSGSAADYGVAPGLRNGTVTYLNAAKTYTTLTPAQIAAMDTGCTAAGGCPNGPGVNAAALAYMRQFPLSNTSSVGDLVNTGGYTFNSPAPVSQVTNIVRLDYNLTPKQTVFVRGNLQSDNNTATFQFPGGVPTSNVFGNNRGLAAGHIWTINEHLINNLRYGWTRYGNASRGGVSSDYVTFGALSALTPTTSSAIILENAHNFADDFTIIKGRHTIQVGANDRLLYDTRTLTNTLYRNASVTQNYLAVGSIANTGQSLDATAAGYAPINSSFSTSYDQAVTAATGLITYASEYVNYSVGNNQLTALPVGSIPTRYFKNLEQEYYGQDQWKITSKLTLTAGLRYTYLGVPYETHGQEVVPSTSLHDFLANRINGMHAGTSYDNFISVIPGGKVNGGPGFWNAQTKNFAPRLAFNYSPDGKTSVRGGFMLAYDHFGEPAVNTYNDNYSFGLSSQYAATVGQQVNTSPRFTSASVVPTSILPTPSAGGSFPVTNAGGLGYITQSFDSHLNTPYSEVFDFSVQRDLHKGLTVTATYIGRLGRHLLLNDDYAMPLNLTDPASGQDYFGAMTTLDKYYDQGLAASSVPNIAYWQNIFPNASYKGYKGTQAVYAMLSRGNETATLYTLDGTKTASAGGASSFRFFHPQFSSLFAQASIGVSSYNGLQLSVRHSITRNFIYDLNYTYSKSLDDGSSPERGSATNGLANTVVNTFNPSQLYAPSDFDARHAVNGDWTIVLPYGHGQHFGANANRLMDELLGGWNLAGLVKFNTGLPFSAVGYRGWGTNWDIRSYDVQIAPVANSGHHTAIKAANGSITEEAFAAGPAAAFASFRQAYVGETGQRNNLRADGYFSLDPGVSKSFRTTERQSLRLAVEAFNVFNSVRFSAPGSGSSSPTVNFGKYSALLNSARQMQFSGRYYF